MSADDFEDDYFEDVETDAKMAMRKPSPGTKVIQPNRKQQMMARQLGKRYNDNQRLIIRNGGGRTLGDGTKKLRVEPEPINGDGASATPPPVGKGSKPGFFNNMPDNHLDVNVKIMKEHDTAPVEEPKLSNEELKYRVSKHIEHNRDLYFVRLVAGSLKRSFESMIIVEDRKNMGVNKIAGKVVIDIKYTYNNELLHAWASIIEKVKLMVDMYVSGWDSTLDIHEKLISRDTTCVAFARYVAFVIMTESNSLVPRNRTRYVIDSDGQLEDKLVIDLMRAIRNEYGVLKQDLIARFL